jgi:fluoroacetyl-CoA thioesterase
VADYRIGATLEQTLTVGDEHAITFLGPEGPRVLSTPRMIGHMEAACRNLVLPMLDPGQDTVGTYVNVYHRSAARMGAEVRFFAELTGVNNRRVEFRVLAAVRDRIVGEGTHERAVIDVRRFRERVDENRG